MRNILQQIPDKIIEALKIDEFSAHIIIDDIEVVNSGFLKIQCLEKTVIDFPLRTTGFIELYSGINYCEVKTEAKSFLAIVADIVSGYISKCKLGKLDNGDEKSKKLNSIHLTKLILKMVLYLVKRIL